MWFKVPCLWILLLTFINTSDGSCSFPSELDGEWYSSHKGLLTLNASMIMTYPIYMSAEVQSLDFICYVKSGYKYLLRALETVSVFGSDIRGYLCIELYRVSAYKYIYYLGTTVSATNNDNIYGRTDATTVTMVDACNRDEPYEEGSFVVLVKSGSLESGLGAASCPSAFLAKYSSVAITDSTGTSKCTGTTTLDGCSDRTMSQYTYSGCSGMFSSGGLYICMHTVIAENYTYLSVWNNDSTVDGTSTYRFTCYVISSSGSTAYATEYPNYCSVTTQTPTSVSSPGLVYTYSNSSETCVYLVRGPSSIGYYILIILGSFAVIAILIFAIFTCKKKRCPCQRREQKPAADSGQGQEEGETLNEQATKKSCLFFCSCSQQEQEDQEEKKSFLSLFACCKQRCQETHTTRTDRVNNTMFILNSLPPLDSLMAGKRGIRIGPIIEANMIKPIPKIEPLYSMYQRNGAEKTMRRASVESTFSFK